MKTIIKQLKIRNFKGIKALDIDFTAKETFIYGDNATCKTTVSDAISYLFRGKNSEGDAEFCIKPLDSDNNEIHNLETIVEAVLDIDTVERKLKKIYFEKWTKKSGSKDKVFTGNTTSFYIDDIEQKTKKGYEDEVINILGADAKMVTMLSNPLYFMYQIEWKERRKILCDMAGGISYSEVYANEEYNELRQHLDINKTKPEDYKKHCSSQIKIIESQKADIPVKLSVLDEQDCEILKTDFEMVKLNKAASIEEKKATLSALSSLTNESAEAEINAKYSRIRSQKESEKSDLRSRFSKCEQKEIDAKQAHRAQVGFQLSDIDTEIAMLGMNQLIEEINGVDYKKHLLSDKIDYTQKSITALRDQFKAVNGSVFQFSTECTCPTCQRDYPAEQIEDMRVKAETDFNTKKENKKLEINTNGQKLKADLEEMLKEQIVLSAQAVEIQKMIADKQEKNAELKAKKLQLEISIRDFKTPEIDEEKKNITAIVGIIDNNLNALSSAQKSELDALSDESVKSQKIEYAKRLIDIDNEIAAIDKILAKQGNLTDNETRRKQYLADEMKFNIEHERYERLEFLTQKLIREHMSKVEESVNSKFSIVKFKLFEKLQNEGEQETCIALVDGVPQDDINTAKRTNAGIDIINALTLHYGVCLPIVIDNRESITKLIDTDSQTINLVKDEKFKILTVK